VAGLLDECALIAVHGILDFMYYNQYQSHTATILKKMDTALQLFHQHKSIFVDLGIHNNFNIPKIYLMLHCQVWVYSGSPDEGGGRKRAEGWTRG